MGSNVAEIHARWPSDDLLFLDLQSFLGLIFSGVSCSAVSLILVTESVVLLVYLLEVCLGTVAGLVIHINILGTYAQM